MYNSVVYIVTLSLILVLSPHLSRFLRLPTAPIEIIIGSLLASIGVISAYETYFSLLAEVGFLYLMFLAGLEVNLKGILKMPKIYIIQSFYFLLILWILAIIFGLIFNLDTMLIVILPLISIGLLATLSKEYGKDVDWIKIAFLVGTIGEVVSITALTISEASNTLNSYEELIYKISLLLVFLGVVLLLYALLRILFWWYPEFKNILMPPQDIQYQDLRLAIGLFFIMIAIMKQLHLELAFGAFIAGLFISTFFHYKKKLEDKISSFGFGFLVPIFFIHVGTSFNLKNILIPEVLLQTAILLIIMFAIRILSAYTLSFLVDKRNAVLTAFALSMPLTLMIAVATIGHEKDMIAEFDYYAVILASLLEVIISMIAIKIIAKATPRK
ncbi:NA+/H+ antiporter (napA), putative [hydrothermal vent metagenome]|uniref:NA+/H+ antiporter (NapA), putative n=1 Tax=hydrothermal vent metagenome TaxID=652676 RepID=A0A1W1CP60_9ZZZZ